MNINEESKSFLFLKTDQIHLKDLTHRFYLLACWTKHYVPQRKSENL